MNKKGFFEFMEYLDEDIIYSPAFWIIAGGSTIAMMLGLGVGKYGNKVVEFLGLGATEYAIPLYMKIILIIAMPIVSYLVMMYFNR